MHRRHTLAAVTVIILLGGLATEYESKADLILTVNGLNPAITFPTIEGTIPIIIAVDGNTPYEPNNIIVRAEGGTLTTVPDANKQYYFQFDEESTQATIKLIAKSGIIIDTQSIENETAIYEMYFFYDSETNKKTAIGIGLEELIALEKINEEQDQSLAQNPVMASNVELSSVEVNTLEPEIQTDYNLPMRQKSILEQYKFKAYCPNSIDMETALPYLQQQFDSLSFQQALPWEMNMLLDGFGGLTRNIIDIDSNIMTNQVWTADNTYRITAGISVEAMLVIEPGTIIEFAFCSAYITVKNGGTLISAGTPENPIIYTCEFLYPDSIGYYYEYIYYIGPNYGYAIVIEETASPSTTLTYNFIEGANTGISTYNITLDHPIENNYLVGNFIGIREYGRRHTDIINNMCLHNSYENIEVFLGDVNGIGDADTVIHITNNTCDATSGWGIAVRGVENQEQAGCGLCLSDGWMSFTVANTGYFGNSSDRFGFEEWEEYNPVYEYEMPYVSGGQTIMDICYLRQDCAFINASDEYIEQTRLIGKTTDANNAPDSGLLDLGFHYPNWSYSNAGDSNDVNLSGSELNQDGIVNFIDFAFFAVDWPVVKDIFDLSDLCNDWLKTATFDPNIQLQITVDPNNGFVDIGFTGWTPDTMRIFLLLNGQVIGGTYRFKDGETITIDISKYGNGVQKLKVVSIDNNYHITCSNIIDVDFSRKLYYCVLPKIYERNLPLPFSAYNSGAGNITVKAYANGGNLVWSQTFSENIINGNIPASITNQYEFDYISFDNDSGQSFAKKVTDPKLPNFSENVQALIVLPKWWIRIHDYQIVWAVQNAFKYHGIIYATLSGSNATYEKVQKYARNKYIKYLYIGCTDGEFRLSKKFPEQPDNLRTNFDLYEPQGGDESYIPIVSIQRSDYLNPNMAPPWCVDLWWQNLPSVALMGFSYLEFAYFDICYSGRLKINANNQLIVGQTGQQGLFDIPHSDMSFALGMAGSGRSNFYQGWYDEAKYPIFPPPTTETEYQRWSRIEWYQLEDGANLYDALYYVIQQQTHFDVNDPVNCYRLKGEGFLEDIYLRSW